MQEQDNDGWDTVPKKTSRRHEKKGDRLPLFLQNALDRGLLSTIDNKSNTGIAINRVMIILVGLPGSGKSTFSKILELKNPLFIRVNQDELGSRGACLEKTQFALDSGKNVVVDRCHATPMQRQHFIDLARENNVQIDVVCFDVSPKVCEQRCLNRPVHATLSRQEASKVISIMSSEYKVPMQDREGFNNMYLVDNDSKFLQVLHKYATMS